jgi:hypothetical protein
MNPAITGSDGIPQPADTAEAEQMAHSLKMPYPKKKL